MVTIAVDAPSRLELRIFVKEEPYPGGRYSKRHRCWSYPLTGFYAKGLLQVINGLSSIEIAVLKSIISVQTFSRLAARVAGHEIWIFSPPDLDENIRSISGAEWGLTALRDAGWRFPSSPCVAALLMRQIGLYGIADFGGVYNLAKSFYKNS